MSYTASNVIIGVGELSVDGTGLGYTSGGVTVVKNEDKLEKEVDQSFSPVGIHKVKETYEVRTNLAEATLANLKIVWDLSQSVVESSPTRTLSWGINTSVTEHALEFKGKSPEGYDRTFTCHKAVVWEVGDVVHAKDNMTVFPVTFRVIPDTSLSAGLEYGAIVDTMTS
jgi:hypothetical protein